MYKNLRLQLVSSANITVFLWTVCQKWNPSLLLIHETSGQNSCWLLQKGWWSCRQQEQLSLQQNHTLACNFCLSGIIWWCDKRLFSLEYSCECNCVLRLDKQHYEKLCLWREPMNKKPASDITFQII